MMETASLSTFLYQGMAARDVPIERIGARLAKGVLSARVNKSDVHDAEGQARAGGDRLVQAHPHEGDTRGSYAQQAAAQHSALTPSINGSFWKLRTFVSISLNSARRSRRAGTEPNRPYLDIGIHRLNGYNGS